jgi:hypothetical protein
VRALPPPAARAKPGVKDSESACHSWSECGPSRPTGSAAGRRLTRPGSDSGRRRCALLLRWKQQQLRCWGTMMTMSGSSGQRTAASVDDENDDGLSDMMMKPRRSHRHIEPSCSACQQAMSSIRNRYSTLLPPHNPLRQESQPTAIFDSLVWAMWQQRVLRWGQRERCPSQGT